MPDQPTDIDEIKKNPKMMAAYLAYTKRRMMLNEVMFYFDKGNAQAIYPKYIDPDSPNAANVESKTIVDAKKLAESGDWGNGDWAGIIKDGKTAVAAALNPDVQANFCDSPEYKDFLKKERMGDPTKAAKLLGISDVKKLKQAMEAQVTGDKQGAKKLFDEILKKEKLKDKAENIMKALEQSGMV